MSIRDGDWTLFSWDAATGRTVWHCHDERGNLVVRTDTPVDHIIDDNSAARAATSNRRFGDWARIASVPASLAFSSGLMEAASQQDDRYLSRWLNDSDNRAWRTHEGRV